MRKLRCSDAPVTAVSSAWPSSATASPGYTGLEPGHEARARVGKDLGRVGDVRVQIAPEW